MQQNLTDDKLYRITYLAGSAEQIQRTSAIAPLRPFDETIIDLLDDVSHKLLENKLCRSYPDVITFGFWIRKSSILQMKKQFFTEKPLRLGKGLVFHIAPSNVAVNFAYSLVSALLCGNANIIKAPSKDFEQVALITNAFQDALDKRTEFKPYINIVKYGHEKEINDVFSAMCDVRVIWGGDETIRQLRQSPMKPRAMEITFADRYSIAYIEAGEYLAIPDKKRIASDFYNDTYLTDQNACTSPRIIFWNGSSDNILKAKELFWQELYDLVSRKYAIHDICAVDKLHNFYCMASHRDDVSEIPTDGNLITRVYVNCPNADLMKWKCHSGFFFEYDCQDITDLKDICSDMACQTLSYIGRKENLEALLSSGIKGVDRIVPVGSTMDFNLIWDGCNLTEIFTRIIDIR